MMLRKALPADAAMIGQIHAESWQGAYRGIVPDNYLNSLTGEHWLEPLTQWLESGALTIWLLETEGTPVGCVSFGAGREEEKQDWGEIVSLYLLPEYFRQGGGTVLLEQAMDQLRQTGFARAYLWVLEENNRARNFYERNGFVANGDSLELEVAGKALTEIRYIINLD